MFFDYKFHAVFTIFAFILIKVLCTDDYDDYTTPRVDLRYLNMSIYCKFQPSRHVCLTAGGKSNRYYFDVHLNRCERFQYGQCNHSYNMFVGRHECMEACQDKAHDEIPEILSEIVFCQFQPDFGDCNSYHPSWYYDITDMTCKGFSYSGCGGNHNRFATHMECVDICGSAFAYYYVNF